MGEEAARPESVNAKDGHCASSEIKKKPGWNGIKKESMVWRPFIKKQPDTIVSSHNRQTISRHRLGGDDDSVSSHEESHTVDRHGPGHINLHRRSGVQTALFLGVGVVHVHKSPSFSGGFEQRVGEHQPLEENAFEKFGLGVVKGRNGCRDLFPDAVELDWAMWLIKLGSMPLEARHKDLSLHTDPAVPKILRVLSINDGDYFAFGDEMAK